MLFGAATDPGQVSAALASRYAVQVKPPTSAHWTYLDTADWRLHNAGMTLRDARRGRGRRLLLSYGAPELLSAPAPARRWPRRVETLPASPVRERIASAVGVRALLPLAEVDVRSLELQLLDDEAKTRVRVRVDQQRLADQQHAALPLRVVVTPLRGYERDGQRCAELLGAVVTPIGDDENTAVSAAFAAAGHAPGQPTVPAVRLDPDAPTVESLAAVLRRWIDIIDSVRPGVLADIDIEYLHDMRTAIRATRSMLRIGGELLPPTHTARFAEEFAWLGRLTTPLRDLDVSLLEVAGLGDTEVAELGDLTPLHQHLNTQRRRALQDLRAGLASPRGSALSGEWRTALAQIADSDQPGPSTRALAGEHARLAYRRIVKGRHASDRPNRPRRAAPAAPPVQADALPARRVRLRLSARPAPRRARWAQATAGLPRRHPGRRRPAALVGRAGHYAAPARRIGRDDPRHRRTARAHPAARRRSAAHDGPPSCPLLRPCHAPPRRATRGGA